jgi:exonuclease III
MAVTGTWNLENLYRPGGAFGPPDQTMYEAKLAAIAAVVERLASDPAEQRYSRVYRGRHELIDHILVSRALLTRVEAAFTGAADAPPPSVGDEPAAAHPAVRACDHVPVLARLSY